MPTTTRQRARRSLLDRLLAAHLEPGDRVGLPTLARKLGTSVTPVREACTQLSYSGVIAYLPNRGFVVPPLSVAEARVLYNTVVALETEALRQRPPDRTDLGRLADLNADFARAEGPERRYRADMAFHEALTGYYADTAVAQLLEDLKVRIYLYERAYLAEAPNVAASAQLHDAIITYLRAGRLQPALAALRQNWLNVEPVLAAAGLTA